MKKRRFDLQVAKTREQDRVVAAVLKLADKKPDKVSDGSVAFAFGDCQMGSSGNPGGYLTFQKYLLKKLRELGYFVSFEDEYNTSQKFPILGHQTNLSGDNGIRIKYCREVKVHIHRGSIHSGGRKYGLNFRNKDARFREASIPLKTKK